MSELRNNKSKRGSGRKGSKNVSRCTSYSTINKILKPSVYQLARGGGFTTIRQGVYCALNNFIVSVLHDAMIHTTGEQRNTVTAEDIAIALTRQGDTSCGFNT